MQQKPKHLMAREVVSGSSGRRQKSNSKHKKCSGDSLGLDGMATLGHVRGRVPQRSRGRDAVVGGTERLIVKSMSIVMCTSGSIMQIQMLNLANL